MSVVITISDDGHVEATHNSGRVLWSMKLDETFVPFETDALDEEIAWLLEEMWSPHGVGGSQ